MVVNAHVVVGLNYSTQRRYNLTVPLWQCLSLSLSLSMINSDLTSLCSAKYSGTTWKFAIGLPRRKVSATVKL